MHYLSKFNDNVCSNGVEFDIDDTTRVISCINFFGGCDGSLKAVAELCEGLPALTVIEKLGKVSCRDKGTSCPMQFAQAIRDVLKA